jgi:hypothetical protein
MINNIIHFGENFIDIWGGADFGPYSSQSFTSWSGETPTGNFSDVFLSLTRIMTDLKHTDFERTYHCIIMYIFKKQKQKQSIIKLNKQSINIDLIYNVDWFQEYKYWLNIQCGLISGKQILT